MYLELVNETPKDARQLPNFLYNEVQRAVSLYKNYYEEFLNLDEKQEFFKYVQSCNDAPEHIIKTIDKLLDLSNEINFEKWNPVSEIREVFDFSLDDLRNAFYVLDYSVNDPDKQEWRNRINYEIARISNFKYVQSADDKREIARYERMREGKK